MFLIQISKTSKKMSNQCLIRFLKERMTFFKKEKTLNKRICMNLAIQKPIFYKLLSSKLFLNSLPSIKLNSKWRKLNKSLKSRLFKANNTLHLGITNQLYQHNQTCLKHLPTSYQWFINNSVSKSNVNSLLYR